METIAFVQQFVVMLQSWNIAMLFSRYYNISTLQHLTLQQ